MKDRVVFFKYQHRMGHDQQPMEQDQKQQEQPQQQQQRQQQQRHQQWRGFFFKKFARALLRQVLNF